MELCELFSQYGLDVILITVANAAIHYVLKKTALKGKPKLATFLAYLCGTVIYAVYESVLTGNAAFIAQNFNSVTEHGMTIGTLTVLLCAAADKFAGGGGAVTVQDGISAILEGFVEESGREKCAEEIVAAAKQQSGAALKEQICAILENYGAEGDEDVLAALIESALNEISGSALKGDNESAQEEGSGSGCAQT